MDDHLLRFDKKKTFCFIDFETLNLCLNFNHNLPWQCAMLKVKGNETVDSKDFYIKWDSDLKISEDAARITRYSQLTMEQRGLPPEDVFPTIRDWLDSADYIVGHNLFHFDLYLIKDFYNMMGHNYRHLTRKIIDTNSLAKGIKFGTPYKSPDNLTEYQYRMSSTVKKGVKTNLTVLGKEYGIDHDYDNLHNALVDLDLNLKIWNKIKWQVEI